MVWSANCAGGTLGTATNYTCSLLDLSQSGSKPSCSAWYVLV
jgi:hypothetical protein